MRFVLIYRPDRAESTPMDPQRMIELGKLCQEMMQTGVVVTSAGLQPSSKGARVRLKKGKVAVTDGPFAETKELVAGINLIEVKTKEEAIELAKRYIAIAGDGETEIRQVFEASDFVGAKQPS